MEGITLVSIVIFIVSLIGALAQFFGLGWAIFIADLFTGPPTPVNYEELQNNFSKSNSKSGKKIGVYLFGLALFCLIIALITI